MSLNQKKKISYDDILEKMGMFVEDGKLRKGNPSLKTNEFKECLLPQNIDINKNLPHVKKILTSKKVEHLEKTIITKEDYINYLVEKKLNRLITQKVKSTKLIMPVDNINVRSNTTSSVLFDFSSPINRINLKGNPNIYNK